MATFSEREYLRYSRHIQLDHIGAAGQSRLKSSSVLVVGCGGLGAPVALYLAGAGAGNITLVDGDTVELGNLQRQVGFVEDDLGLNKAERLAARLRAMNGDIQVNAIASMLDDRNVAELVAGKDLVIDCSDRFDARRKVNRSCIAKKLPWIYASVLGSSGQCALFSPPGPCFECLFPNVPEQAMDCNSAGVLASVPGILGTIQATLAINLLAGSKAATASAGQLALVETCPLGIRTIQVTRREDCPACGVGAANTAPGTSASMTAVNARAAAGKSGGERAAIKNTVDCKTLASLMGTAQLQLVDVRSEEEHAAFNIGGVHCAVDDIENAPPGLDAGKLVVCYCQTGRRSIRAAEVLRAKSYQAASLEGGLQAWLASNPNQRKKPAT